MSTKSLWIGFFFASVVAAAASGFAVPSRSDAFWPKVIGEMQHALRGRPMLFIAHAGGGYKNVRYTNSIEALEYNYDQGIRFFEVDFMRTKDGKIVCIHHWQNGALTFEEFRRRRHDPSSKVMRFKNCTLNSLGRFLAKRKDAFLILDTKADQKEGGERHETAYDLFNETKDYLTEEHSIALTRIIPQAYNLDEVERYKADGYPNIIFTLYKVGNDKSFSKACKFKGVAITAPIDWVLNGKLPIQETSLPKECPLFVHGMKNVEQFMEAVAIAPQVVGVYTSSLRPE